MNPDVYAKAMFDLSQGGKGAEEIVSGTVRSLKQRGALGLLPKILSSYSRLMSKVAGHGPVLTIAREADSDMALEESQAPSGCKVVVDSNLIGGYRLEGEGTLVDNSFKAKLLQAYRSATKA